MLWQMQLGIHTGPVVAAVIGEKLPRYSVYGDTVNVSSRMMSYSEPGQINVSARSFGWATKVTTDL